MGQVLPRWVSGTIQAALVLVVWGIAAPAWPADPPSTPPRADEELAPAPHPLPAETALALAALFDLAVQNNPDVAIAQARALAARGLLVQAGLYPNPWVGWDADDMGHPDHGAGKQGPMIIQTFVTGGKLRLASGAAANGVQAADWQAITVWFDVVTRVRLAYYEVLTAQATVEANEQIVRIAEEGLSVAEKLFKAGVGTQPDVLRAQVELNENRIQLGVAQERLHASWKLLAVAVGFAMMPCGPVAGDLARAAPCFDYGTLLDAILARSSEVQQAQARVLQAEFLVRRARAEVVPDLRVQTIPFRDFPDGNYQLQVQAGVSLPLFNRNQGNIRAALADLARIRDEVRQVELSLEQRLALAFQRYRSARLQVEAYERQILPTAAESLRLVRLGFERGDARYDYTAVLQAQRTLAVARVTYVTALGNLWRSVSELLGLLQIDDPNADAGGPPHGKK